MRLLLALPALFLPSVASAATFTTLVGVFNIFIGVMLAIAVLLYIGGMILWLIRLGAYPSYRDEAIDLLKWPVAILFVAIVLLGAYQLIQRHADVAMKILGVIIVLGIIWLILTVASKKSQHKEEEH